MHLPCNQYGAERSCSQFIGDTCRRFMYLPWSWEAAGNTIGARWTGESTARPRFMCNSLRMQFDVHLPAPELALCSCAANPLRSQKQLSAPSWGRGRHSAAQRDLV